MHWTFVLILLPATAVISSHVEGHQRRTDWIRTRRNVIGSFLFGKWCSWGPWSQCDSFGGIRVDDDDGGCYIKGVIKRNRTCKCPPPKLFINRCAARDGKESKECRSSCGEEAEGVSIPSFYVFLIISVSCIVVVGFFTCLYSFLRICYRHQRLRQRQSCCPDFTADSSPESVHVPAEVAAVSESETRPADEELPPSYLDVVMEERAKNRSQTPPPLYNALFMNSQPPPDSSTSRDCETAEQTLMLPRRREESSARRDSYASNHSHDSQGVRETEIP